MDTGSEEYRVLPALYDPNWFEVNLTMELANDELISRCRICEIGQMNILTRS
jgi:hypothetical protein